MADKAKSNFFVSNYPILASDILVRKPINFFKNLWGTQIKLNICFTLSHLRYSPIFAHQSFRYFTHAQLTRGRLSRSLI